MDEARIAELLAPFLGDDRSGISPAQLRSISIYIDILLRWNARINLTAVREPEEIVTRHFGESLFSARYLFPKDGMPASPVLRSMSALTRPRVIDVGSGAGFPGLPIKIWAPHVQLILIEANQKKATFLREVVRSLALTDVEVFAGRAETFPGGKADVVTLRAVERFDTVLPSATALVGPRGCLAILIGAAQVEKVGQLAPALRWRDPVPLPLSDNRVLILGCKEAK
jgi:16S rRNA (guanine527-N7)-methyltransferase